MFDQLISVFESIMIVTALSTDAFIASFAYGTNKVKIPFTSVTIINVVCSSILAISLFLGTIVKNVIPESITHIICFLILFILGTYKLIDSIGNIISSRRSIHKKLDFKIWGFNFNTSISSCPDQVDYDVKSKILRPIEAASLSIALSLDGLAVGIGAALVNSNNVQIVLFSLISDMVAVMAGCFVGNKVAEKINFNLSWLSGILLIALSFIKL